MDIFGLMFKTHKDVMVSNTALKNSCFETYAGNLFSERKVISRIAILKSRFKIVSVLPFWKC